VKRVDAYIDLDGNEVALDGLDAEERRLVARLRRRARTHPDWSDFGTYWMRAVAEFYDARGLSRSALLRTAAYRVGQDLSNRLGIDAGLIRPPSYRDDLEDLIDTRFPSRRAFCEATGISEDMLSHVLAGRKDLSLAALTKGLGRIGYALHIRPAAPVPAERAGRKKRTG
jgi:hypothetical protein